MADSAAIFSHFKVVPCWEDFVSSAHSLPDPVDNYQLFERTTFGFRSIIGWPTALQRVTFFAIASAGEFLSATRLIGWLVQGLAWGVAALLTLLTPHAAANLEDEPPRHGLRILVWATLLAAFVTSLGGNAAFTWMAGTLTGDDPQRYYYLQDGHNLILYAFVAPIYMAASAAIIFCALSSLSVTGSTAFPIRPVLRLGFVLSWMVILAGLVQVNYFQDNIMGVATADPASLDARCRDRVFWFLEKLPLADGGRIVRLNSAGVYYLCMQFCHMAVIAAAVWFTITAMFTLYRLGLRLTPAYLAGNGGAEPVRAKLKRFTLLELSAKCLALILTVHIFIWGDSCLHGDHNIRVTAMFLLAFAFFILGHAPSSDRIPLAQVRGDRPRAFGFDDRVARSRRSARQAHEHGRQQRSLPGPSHTSAARQEAVYDCARAIARYAPRLHGTAGRGRQPETRYPGSEARRHPRRPGSRIWRFAPFRDDSHRPG